MHKIYSLLLIATTSLFPLMVHAQEDTDAALQEMAEEKAEKTNAEASTVIEAKAIEKEEAGNTEPENIESESTEETSVTDGKISPLPTDEASYEERLKLAEKMHEIWPIRPKIENALDVVSGQISADKRMEFKSGMRRAISFDALEEQSIEAMADIFSVAELNAMIDFYGSKEGRSVSYKTTDYEKALLPLMTKMIDKALLDNKLGTPK